MKNSQLQSETRDLIKEFENKLTSDSSSAVSYLEECKNKYEKEREMMKTFQMVFNFIIILFIIERSKKIKEKYVSYIKYIEKTWLPEFENGMLNYQEMNEDQWTNNPLEGYHGKWQLKITK